MSITTQQMVQILALREGIFPHPNWTIDDRETCLHAWLELFKNEDAGMVYQAMKIALKESSFEPKPHLVSEVLTRIKSPKTLVSAAEIWTKLTDYARQSLSEIEVFKILKNYPAATKALKAIGWERIRFADLQRELPFLRKDFISYYEDINENSEKLAHQQSMLSAPLSKLVSDTSKKLAI